MIELRLLQELLMSEMGGQASDVQTVSEDTGLAHTRVSDGLAWLERRGLLRRAADGVPRVTTAGLQFVGDRGDIEDAILCFLPQTVDDLHARRALLRAGMVLVDEFRAALVAGWGEAHARELLPTPFAPLVDRRMAHDLFAAAVALITRLSDEKPPGSLAEELIAYALVDEARVWLDIAVDRGELVADSASHASDQIERVLKLIRPAAKALFAMQEPADAVVALYALDDGGVAADLRPEAWFDPVPPTAPTGYLHVE